MAPGTIALADGSRRPLSQFSQDEDDLVREVAYTHVVFDPLPEEDQEAIQPERIVAHLRNYLKGTFRTAREPEVRFCSCGQIAGTSYWVYESEPREEYPLYIYVVKNGSQTEIVCGERSGCYQDHRTQFVHDRLLTPPQGALLDYLISQARKKRDC